MRLHHPRHQFLARHHDNPRKRLLWGASLIAVGTVFLLDRLAVLDLAQYLGPQTRWWHYLPLLLALGGVIAVVSAQSARQVLKGLIDIVLGTWVFACLEHLWALTFSNSWPIVLIAYGLQMLLRGWLGHGQAPRGEVAQ
ncbi:LiaF transmembrane domain-containing protein [Candidatus Aalborgicola defluviihabitans]|jgi:hypothetical protein|uniref:LiaF transmembrane domain-containing protein n=1 Tax=Candidatus Aalborgicola defluviihabitans TaxID=3386187 RepID=UPI001E115645|nr:hypothetical protein [Burkholderiales bacterium]